MATNPLATNSQWTPQDAPAQVAVEAHDLTTNIDEHLKNLEGKGEVELRNLQADAQHEESNAKQDLYMLRQRIANLGTDIKTNEEILLTAAKRRVAEGMAYLRALEIKIRGEEPVAPAATPEPVQDEVPANTVNETAADTMPVTASTSPAQSASDMPVGTTAQDVSTAQEPPKEV